MSAKVVIPVVLMVAGISWLAFSNLSKATYFYTVDELPGPSDPVFSKSLKVKGRIVVGSIVAGAVPVRFTLHEGGAELPVKYVGHEPLPDMFKERAEAVVEGRMGSDGVFEAHHVQAKCASKYEAGVPNEALAAEGYETAAESAYPAK